MTERACFSEQLSVGNLWFTRTCVPNGKATCAPPVRTCALPTLRPFRILPSFLSQGLIKGGVLLRSGRTCVSASQVSCDQHWSWHLQSKWKQFWVCIDGIRADCSRQCCVCECFNRLTGLLKSALCTVINMEMLFFPLALKTHSTYYSCTFAK